MRRDKLPAINCPPNERMYRIACFSKMAGWNVSLFYQLVPMDRCIHGSQETEDSEGEGAVWPVALAVGITCFTSINVITQWAVNPIRISRMSLNYWYWICKILHVLPGVTFSMPNPVWQLLLLPWCDSPLSQVNLFYRALQSLHLLLR